ncbi:hypothetical protein D3C87_1777870 [compost metagenome]
MQSVVFYYSLQTVSRRVVKKAVAIHIGSNLILNVKRKVAEQIAFFGKAWLSGLEGGDVRQFYSLARLDL